MERKSSASSSDGAKHLRVMVVEDYRDTADAIGRYLRSRGHEVSIAPDVATALDLAAHANFDVVLSDLALPDGDGWRLLQRLTESGPVKAVAMSGFNTPADIARSIQVGFTDHLAKPVPPQKLNAALERAAAG